MDSKQPTAAEVWVTTFFIRLPECLKKIKEHGFEGCVHAAADDASLALGEFTKRFPNEVKS